MIIISSSQIQVDTRFIEDKFNLTGLSEVVTHYDRALDLILENDIEDDPELLQEVERSAELLYGLIHARYIATPRGTEAMVCLLLFLSF
jgi:casein kinase II subunit beta